VVVWPALFVFFWGFFSWLTWIIDPQTTIPSWMQASNFAFAWCFLIAWNRRHPERAPKPSPHKPTILTIAAAAGVISAAVALISSAGTLALGRPGWVPSALYSLGLPIVALGFALIIEKWGRLSPPAPTIGAPESA
jgi:hypothetical protein